jgi:hypothetical protein
MTDTIDAFARQGLGVAATANDVRNQYEPKHGDGNLPDDAAQAVVEERQREIAATTTVVDLDMDVVLAEEVDEVTELRNKIAVLERALEGSTIENQMFRRFHGSKDDTDQQLFMQSVVFLASQALDFKMDEDRIQEFFNGKGECLHPEDSIKDTGFGVHVCTECKKHVEPVTEPPCAHENTIEYGTVGMKQCLICGTNLARDAFTRLDTDRMALAEAVGVSIPKGQPTLNPGLAPRPLKDA